MSGEVQVQRFACRRGQDARNSLPKHWPQSGTSLTYSASASNLDRTRSQRACLSAILSTSFRLIQSFSTASLGPPRSPVCRRGNRHRTAARCYRLHGATSCRTHSLNSLRALCGRHFASPSCCLHRSCVIHYRHSDRTRIGHGSEVH